eukprot:296208-Alexandrium_andersonii.AAC.1
MRGPCSHGGPGRRDHRSRLPRAPYPGGEARKTHRTRPPGRALGSPAEGRLVDQTRPQARPRGRA